MTLNEKLFFNSFREIVKAVNSTLNIREVLKILAKEVSEVINVKGSAIRLSGPNRQTLELVSCQGLSEKYIEKGPLGEASEG